MCMVADVEKIHYRKRLVYTHQNLDAGVDRSFHQSEVRCAGCLVKIGDQTKFAMDGPHCPFCHAFDQAFRLAAVMDEIGDGAD